MNTNKTQIETEKKYLIQIPDIAALFALPGAVKEDMEQIYLVSEAGKSRRLRKSIRGCDVHYIYNEKSPVSAASKLETERNLSKEEYDALKKEADSSRNAIYKTRYTVPAFGFLYEIDIYSFSKNRAILEVELEDESVCPPMPPFLRILSEVTNEKAFSNHAISKEIPPELLI